MLLCAESDGPVAADMAKRDSAAPRSITGAHGAAVIAGFNEPVGNPRALPREEE